MNLIKKIFRIFGIVTVDPFKLNMLSGLEHFKQLRTDDEKNDHIIRKLSLNALVHQNRVDESCKDCEIRWTYYSSVADSIDLEKLLEKCIEYKNKLEKKN